MKPLIGITMSPDMTDGGRAGRLYSNYMNAVREAGGIPVALHDGADEAEYLAQRLDGLLLSGGNDVDAALFGEENRYSEGVDAGRDALEVACVKAFGAQGKPVLGICRGMQVMAAALGGTLWQDIRKQTAIDHGYVTHPMIVREGTFLSPLVGERCDVNSTHHQSVRALPPRFMVAAVAPDGIIEAMQATDARRLYAVQFHPERLFQSEGSILGIFRLLTY